MDYSNLQALLQGVTKIKIEKEDSDSNNRHLEQGSASITSEKKRRMSCNKEKKLSKPNEN